MRDYQFYDIDSKIKLKYKTQKFSFGTRWNKKHENQYKGTKAGYYSFRNLNIKKTIGHSFGCNLRFHHTNTSKQIDQEKVSFYEQKNL